MQNTITIKFDKNFSPRVSGEVVELDSRIAEHYLALGVAHIYQEGEEDKDCERCNEDHPCEDCNKAADPVESTEEKMESKPSKKKK